MYIKSKLFRVYSCKEGYWLTCYVGSHGIREYILKREDGKTYADLVTLIKCHKQEHLKLMGRYESTN